MYLTRRIFQSAALIAALGLAACGGGSDAGGNARSAYEREGDHTKGSVDAPLTLIEYASPACPACRGFHQGVGPTIESHIESGNIRFIFREMLTGQPQLAMAGLMLARCVPEDRYFDALDLLFEQQPALFQAMQTREAPARLAVIARTAGLSEARYGACMQDDAIFEEVQAANERAAEDGIASTPTIIINGDQLDFIVDAETSAPVWSVNGVALEDAEGRIPATYEGETFERVIQLYLAAANE